MQALALALDPAMPALAPLTRSFNIVSRSSCTVHVSGGSHVNVESATRGCAREQTRMRENSALSNMVQRCDVCRALSMIHVSRTDDLNTDWGGFSGSSVQPSTDGKLEGSEAQPEINLSSQRLCSHFARHRISRAQRRSHCPLRGALPEISSPSRLVECLLYKGEATLRQFLCTYDRSSASALCGDQSAK